MFYPLEYSLITGQYRRIDVMKYYYKFIKCVAIIENTIDEDHYIHQYLRTGHLLNMLKYHIDIDNAIVERWDDDWNYLNSLSKLLDLIQFMRTD